MTPDRAAEVALAFRKCLQQQNRGWCFPDRLEDLPIAFIEANGQRLAVNGSYDPDEVLIEFSFLHQHQRGPAEALMFWNGKCGELEEAVHDISEFLAEILDGRIPIERLRLRNGDTLLFFRSKDFQIRTWRQSRLAEFLFGEIDLVRWSASE